MAKRIQFSQHGNEEVLEYASDQPDVPNPDQVQVCNHAIGVNFIDTYYHSGL